MDGSGGYGQAGGGGSEFSGASLPRNYMGRNFSGGQSYNPFQGTPFQWGGQPASYASYSPAMARTWQSYLPSGGGGFTQASQSMQQQQIPQAGQPSAPTAPSDYSLADANVAAGLPASGDAGLASFMPQPPAGPPQQPSAPAQPVQRTLPQEPYLMERELSKASQKAWGKFKSGDRTGYYADMAYLNKGQLPPGY